jgi:hypothetical protein
MQIVTAEKARTLLLDGKVPEEGLQIEGRLDLSGDTRLSTLPGRWNVWELDLNGCTALTALPHELLVHRLELNDCAALKTLPAGLSAYRIRAQRAGFESLPEEIVVTYELDLTDCTHLRRLPEGLRVGSLIIRNCFGLDSLPEDLHLYFLDASNCVNLKHWGERGTVEVGNINLSGCRQLTYLPDWMTKIAQLNITNCVNLRRLPDNLRVTSTIELANSGLTSLPPGCRKATLRWNGVGIDERIAFRPETITAKEVMAQENIELRRVMLERMGYEKFFKESKAKELDKDFDPGGIRRLLRVEFQDQNRFGQRDEPLVCLSVLCPSTARSYIIRVPPTMTTCRQAAAWVAGFDDPKLYNPVQET